MPFLVMAVVVLLVGGLFYVRQHNAHVRAHCPPEFLVVAVTKMPTYRCRLTLPPM